MVNFKQFRNNKGKIWLPPYIIQNMCNYAQLFGVETNYNPYTGILNLYLPSDVVVSYYTTKNFANVYRRGSVIAKLQGWINVLRYLSMVEVE